MCRSLALLLVLAPTLAAAAAPQSPGATLDQLVEKEWRWRLAEFPGLATHAGVHEHDDRLESARPEVFAARRAHWQALADALAALPDAGLTPDQRITREVLAEETRASLAAIDTRAYLMPLNGDSGFHIGLTFLPRSMRFETALDYRNYLSRLAAIPRYVDEHLALLDQGLAAGLTVPRVVLAGRAEAPRRQATTAPEDSVFAAPFKAFPPSIPPAEAAAIRERGLALIRTAVIPAYAKVARYLEQTYIPGARTTLAATAMPGGAAYYASRIAESLTTAVAPDELHELGLAEVKRIRARMEEVRARAGVKGSLEGYFARLRNDPSQYASTPEQLLAAAALVAKQVDGQLPRFFGVLPRQPFTIEPVPADIAPFYTAGRYVPGNAGAGKPGTYWVNTFELKSRPLYALPALTLHEAVPGHHLQAATAAERDGLHPLRRYAYFDVTGEGWALYAERLGEEMGVYTTPAQEMGRLTYEMWRACRLVVDTGLHARGWTRAQALDFLKDNTALSLKEIDTEVSRYIAWPGQALAYKYGELALTRLRARAEAALGPRFDLRAFHDLVLGLGSVPLSVWEREVDRLIASSPEVQGRSNGNPPRGGANLAEQ